MTDATDRARAELVEHFRKALMREHHHDWDMETIAEAAHGCARAMEQCGWEIPEDVADSPHRRLFFAIGEGVDAEPVYRRKEKTGGSA